MFKSFVKRILLAVTIIPLLGHSQMKQTYLPPVFTDKDRLTNIQGILPKIDNLYKDYAKKQHFPGYAFGIMVDGKLIYSNSSGYADIRKKIPATSRSMFRIASMTKSFTAMAILKLRDAGKLHLDDPVYLYIPEIKSQQLTKDAPTITIRDLLTHASGYPQDDPWADRKLNATDEALIALLKKGLYFSQVPETAYEYSNLSYAMLGYVIKKTSGVSYQEYIATQILQPLGMKNAEWSFTKVSPTQLAQGYRSHDGSEEELLNDGSFGAMGGLITSIESFSRYVALHQSAWPPRDDMETGPIKRSSIREMHQAWRFNAFNSHYKYLDGRSCTMVNAYGYGLRWSKDCDSKVYVGHSGGLPGFGSNWFIMPEYGIGVILLVNTTYAAAAEINLHVLDTLINDAGLKPRQLSPSTILKNRQNNLITLLPAWQEAETSVLFANNFFLDNSLASLKNATSQFFKKAGKILRVSEVTPENQLRGYFIMEGEKANLKVSFTLTPENPPLIQTFRIEDVAMRG